MSAINLPTKISHIIRDEKISGGRPVIVGTRIRVSQIALEYEHLGWTPDQIIDAHPHLTLAQVHAALAYYYENLAQFHKELTENQEFVNRLRLHYPARISSVNVS